MPPKPTAPTSRVSHTCTLWKAVISRTTVAAGSPGVRGTNAWASTAVTTPMTATAAKVVRHPRFWPIHVATGTPMTLASGIPSITRLTARPPWPERAMSMATREAMPKNAPCGSPVRKRAVSSAP